MIDLEKANFKSMSFEQLLRYELPKMIHSKKRREEILAFIANELRIKAPKP